MSNDLEQVNIKIACPVCYSKWEVSENSLNNVSKAEFARQICGCNTEVKIPSALVQKSYSSRLNKVIKESKREEENSMKILSSA